jgi:glutaminyl-tRNA synthetase
VSDTNTTDARPTGKDFIRTIVDRDLAEGRYREVVTRFPPEPNGYLHIGHAKSIVLNFGIAREYGGRCHLRFDDTNPLTEAPEYAEAIEKDVRWLGYDWDALYYAADYFERLYGHAETLVKKGLAYVDSQSEEEIREGRGSLTEPGVDSPYRTRSVEENQDLFRRMREGEFPDGAHVLRAKIDMAHPNMIMRDPLLYRIRHADHYRAGGDWCIYPLYDFAHCLEDAIESISHSLCTLEFENNREIYDWLLDKVGYDEPRPHQYEFARLNVEYTVLSKRRLIRLVQEGHVNGWDDPRMPTIAGIRRRGIPAEALRAFCEMVGVTKVETRVDLGKLEYVVRDQLNRSAPRVMAVLEPIPLEITNYPDGAEEWLDAPSYPHEIGVEGSRSVPFSGELLVEREDVSTDPPAGWRRLAPGREVRLRHAYTVRCNEVVTDPESGEVTAIRCTYDPDTLSRNPDRLVQGVIHWVSSAQALPCEVRLYDRLFGVPDPDDVPDGKDFLHHLSDDSLVVLPGARIEPSVAGDAQDARYQFERVGYFWRDPVDGVGERLVFNRIESLRDTWGRAAAAMKEQASIERSGGEGSAEIPASAVAVKSPEGPEDRVSQEREDARRADSELATRFRRYQEDLGLNVDDADILTGSRRVSDLFEDALEVHAEPRSVAAWVVNEVLRELKEHPAHELPFEGRDLGRLAAMVDAGRVSRIAAKTVFAEMVTSGADPEAVVKERGLAKVSDPSALEPLVDQVMDAWPAKVREYRGGKSGLLGFFVGEVMRKSEGTADPRRVREMLEERLDDLLKG